MANENELHNFRDKVNSCKNSILSIGNGILRVYGLRLNYKLTFRDFAELIFHENIGIRLITSLGKRLHLSRFPNNRGDGIFGMAWFSPLFTNWLFIYGNEFGDEISYRRSRLTPNGTGYHRSHLRKISP